MYNAYPTSLEITQDGSHHEITSISFPDASFARKLKEKSISVGNLVVSKCLVVTWKSIKKRIKMKPG